jgi:copper resistance protein B
MKTLFALLLAGIATPALGQQTGIQANSGAPASATCLSEHAAMGHCTLSSPAAPAPKLEPAPAPTAACSPEHAAMGHCRLPPSVAEPAKPLAPPCSPEHAAMGHCSLTEAATSGSAPDTPSSPAAAAPSEACVPEHAALGHCAPAPAAAQEPPPAAAAPACSPEHAAMGHCATTLNELPQAPPPAAALAGPENAADAVYGAGAMALAREALRREHGDLPAHKVLFDRIEARGRQGADGYLIDGQAWFGGDIDKLWLKTEVEGEWNGSAGGEVQALWSHAIDPWFDLQAGVRYDAAAGPDRAHLVLGVQGLAPYWWELDGALFVSNRGHVTARAEAEHDIRITRKLILQPRAELDIAFQDVPELAIGSGVSSAALGARLRYQIAPTFAPYLGVEYDRALGDTARFRRAVGESPGGWNLLVGVRIWL